VRLIALTLIAVHAFLPVRAHALPPVATMLTDRVLGDERAKVTLVEYSSLTCPHCADFHRDTLPLISKDYIQKGQLRYVLRDFPLDAKAMAAAMIARCAPPDRYFTFIDMLFRNQQAWARSSDSIVDLKVRAQLAGLSSGDVDQCLASKDLLEGIQARASDAQRRDTISSTPTFIIGANKLSGALPYAELKSVINQAIANAR
jgi:protein-disulfide isomerase